MANYYATNFSTASAGGAGANKTRWTPTIAYTGDYDVYVRLPDSNTTTRSASVPFTVNYSGGSATVNVNQQTGLGGIWVPLGTYTMAAGSTGYVEVSDQGVSGTGIVVVADAVAFVMPGQRVLQAAASAPALTGSVKVNDGTAQRSMVTSLTFTTSVPATLGSDALTLSLHSGGPVGFTVTPSNPSGDGKTYVLSFSGSGVVGSSLPDGIYDLKVKASSVTDGFGQSLSGGDQTLTLHRLYGDADGNKSVNSLDNFKLRSTFGLSLGAPAYLWYFDYDGNNSVNSLDNFQFRSRFGVTYSY